MCLSITFASSNSLQHCSRKACPRESEQMNKPKENGKKRIGKLDEDLFERDQKQSESLLKLERFCLGHSTTYILLNTQVTEPIWWLARFACADIGVVCRLDRSWGHAAGGAIKKGASKRNRLLCYIHPAQPGLDTQQEFYSLKMCEGHVGRVKALQLPPQRKIVTLGEGFRFLFKVYIEIVLFAPLISWREQVFLVLFMFASGENYLCKHQEV